MAFTGVPVVTYIGAGLVRITGVSVAGAEVGTIGLHESTQAPDIRLPAAFQPRPEGAVTLQDSVAARFELVTAPLIGDPLVTLVGKSGNTPADFEIAFSNTADEPGGSTGELEIYVAFHT
jgi:hypothetical protein